MKMGRDQDNVDRLQAKTMCDSSSQARICSQHIHHLPERNWCTRDFKRHSALGILMSVAVRERSSCTVGGLTLHSTSSSSNSSAVQTSHVRQEALLSSYQETPAVCNAPSRLVRITLRFFSL